jgi:hypothetical protein
MQRAEALLEIIHEHGNALTETDAGEPGAVKIARPVCAVRRFVVSPAQPGRTRREVLGSPDLPRGESPTGTRACQGRGGRLEASRAGYRKIRTIWLKLDCLKPNPQR